MRTIQAFAVFSLFLWLAPYAAAAEEKLQIVCSINPISALVREIGGAELATSTLVSGQSDVHGFELKPSQLRSLYAAALIVQNGFGLEPWSRGFDSKLKGKLLELAEAVPDAGPNPHTWLDPILVTKQVNLIAKRLCSVRSERCADFEARAEILVVKLRSLDQEIRTEVSTWPSKSYVSYHRSWNHFAARYGLTSVGDFKVSHSTETTIKRLAQVLDAAKRSNVRAFWLDTQTSSDRVSELVKDAGLKLAYVDELGAEGEDYFALMRRNVRSISLAMKN